MHDDGDHLTNHPDMETQVSALERMNLTELRRFWGSQWGAPPKLRSAQLLRLIIAWRLQAAAEGGLKPKTRVRLRSKAMPRTLPPPAGTRLTREYKRPGRRGGAASPSRGRGAGRASSATPGLSAAAPLSRGRQPRCGWLSPRGANHGSAGRQRRLRRPVAQTCSPGPVGLPRRDGWPRLGNSPTVGETTSGVDRMAHIGGFIR
jgi:hypothetical protein